MAEHFIREKHDGEIESMCNTLETILKDMSHININHMHFVTDTHSTTISSMAAYLEVKVLKLPPGTTSWAQAQQGGPQIVIKHNDGTYSYLPVLKPGEPVAAKKSKK